MLISVIVPVYNAEKYLRECLDSILNQTYKNLEIILINDGSLDKSGEICDEYARVDSRIKVLHRENGGVSVARNIGLDEAKGELIAFVDSDDYLSETMIQKLYDKIENADISICRFDRVYTDRVVCFHEDNLSLFIKQPYNFEYIMVDKYNKTSDNRIDSDKIFGSVCRTLFRRKIIEDNRIRFEKGVKIAEDRLFLLEYTSYCERAGGVDEYLYHYRADVENSATALSKNYHKNLNEAQKALAEKEFVLIENNKKLSKKEKKRLKFYLENTVCYTVALNEIFYNDVDYLQKLREIFADSFFSGAIKLRGLWSMHKFYGTSIKTITLYIMIKFRLWKIMRWRLNER